MQIKVRFEVFSGLYCEFLTALIEKEIYVSDIKSTDFGFTADCMARDYKKIAMLAKKYQCRTKICQKKGVYFKTKWILKRKGLLLGGVLVFVYIFIFSHIIWRIDIVSSDTAISQDVQSLLYNEDIYAGSIYSKEKNSRTVQRIFMDVDNVGYVTMNFSGGVLTCKIDSAINKLPYLENSTNGNIVATESGVIKDLRVYKGFSQVQAGQSVYKGDILVSATYIDRNGTLQQVMPRAYVEAVCEKEYVAQIDFEKEVLVRTGQASQQTLIKFCGLDIKTKGADIKGWDNYDTERRFENMNILGFCLPVTVEKTFYYRKAPVQINRDEDTAFLAAVKVIEAMVENDRALIGVTDREYRSMADSKSLTVVCTVYGNYDITK